MRRSKKIFFILYFIITAISASAGTLQCSQNGTEIIYVNGMNNTLTEAEKSRDAISKLLVPIKAQLDSKEKINVTKVYNEGLGIGNDLIEYVIDRARLYGINDPWKYYSALSISSGIDTALKQRLISRKNFLPSGYSSSGLTVKQLAILKGIYNSYFISTAALQSSNELLQEELKSTIVTKLANNHKVILVAHSQGNAIINAVTKNLPNEIDGVDKVGKYLGALHVATPVTERASSKSRKIKLSTDRVVGFLYGISGPANYEFQYFGIGGSLFSGTIFGNLTTLAADYLAYNSPYLLGHNMTEIYLGSRAARKIGSSDEYLSMSEVFKQNMVEVADLLEDNCDSNSKVIFCNAGLLPNTMNFALEGNVDFSLNHIFPESGINSDPHTCECHEVNLKEGGNAINVSGSGSFGTASYELVPFKGTIYGTGGLQYFSTSVDFVNGQLKVGVVEGIYATNYCGPFVYKN